jgi:c-di-GMP-binding flagellar brake protein YcgR
MSEYGKEKRKLLRRKLNLDGYYFTHSVHDPLGKIERAVVKDLSAGGCRLSLADNHGLHLNDSITLSFRLDDAERTKIQKEAVVIRVDGNFVSCKFESEFNKDIWLYIHGEISK